MAAFDPGTNPTISSGYSDVTFAAWVSDNILDEERPYEAIKPYLRYEGPQASVAMNFPIQDDPGPTTSYTEGSGLANTAMTTDVKTATAALSGMAATVTDEVNETAVINVTAQIAGVLGRGLGEEFETTACAFLDDFANTTGSAGNPTTYAILLEATNQLAQRDQTGMPVGVLDPSAIGNVRIDLGTSGAAALSRPDVAAAGDFREVLGSGPVFTDLAGCPWFQTSVVTSTGGGVFISGVALGLYELRPPRLESQRYVTTPGTTLAATSRYGIIEIRDRAGETILTN